MAAIITLSIPDADVDAMSASWAGRVKPLEDTDGVRIETAAEHLERAYRVYLANELKAARIAQAGRVVKAAKTDGELQAAMLAEHKLRHPA